MTPTARSSQATARQIVDEAIERDLRQRRSFGFESTYSGKSRPAIVRQAKELGYAVHAVFIGTSHHDINIDRVRMRVQEGGHDIPTDEIVRRWGAVQDNLRKTWACFDTITILDNSGHEPAVIARQQGQLIETHQAAPRWARNLLQRPTDMGETERDQLTDNNF